MTPTSALSWSTGMAILTTLFEVLTLGTLWLILHPLSLAGATLIWIASLIGTGTWIQLKTRKWQTTLISLGLTCFFLALASLITIQILDTSYDGQNYHLSAIFGLMDGWQPHYADQPMPPELNSLWIDVYPKAAWTIQASWGFLSGIEGAKGLMPVLMLTCVLLGYPLLQDMGFSRTVAAAGSLLLALNPIALVQWPTFYNDGLVASLFSLIILCGTHAVLKNNLSSLTLAGMASIMVAGLKFSTLVVGGVLILPAIILFWAWNKETRHKATLLYASGLVLAVIILWDPYAQNWLTHGHPFYPLMGENTIDILTGNTPPGIHNSGFLTSRIVALSMTSDGILTPTAIKNSFLFSAVYDQRIGGFGPFMGGIFIISLILLVFLSRYIKHPVIRVGLGVCAIITISFVIHPEGWWSRYVPQLWVFFIIIGLITARVAPIFHPTRILGGVLLSLLALNAVGMGWAGLSLAQQRHAQVIEDMLPIEAAGTVYTSPSDKFGAIIWRLENRGVLIIRTEPVCSDPLPLRMSGGRTFCPAIP